MRRGELSALAGHRDLLVIDRLTDRLSTTLELLRYLAQRQRYFLLPLAVMLLLTALLLVATEGLGPMAPFVYALF